jgi:hypothetical protein
MIIYKPSVPKPCHEEWDSMTPDSKGRFCDMCAKSVIDFTAMTDAEIRTYLVDNRDKKICGRFKQEQLDSIVIQVPQHMLLKQMSFRKMFLLALLLCMGNTLLSCDGRQVTGEVIIDNKDTVAVSVDSIPTADTGAVTGEADHYPDAHEVQPTKEQNEAGVSTSNQNRFQSVSTTITGAVAIDPVIIHPPAKGQHITGDTVYTGQDSIRIKK